MGNFFGGAHLSNSGLHLAHFYGSIIPLLKQKSKYPLYFIIGDVGCLEHNERTVYENNLTKLTSQLYAINKIYSTNIIPIRQSVLNPQFYRVKNELLKNCTLKQIINSHPSSRLIKKNNINIYLDNLLFPLNTTSMFILLNIENVLLTGNDRTLINFCSRLIQKISNRKNVQITRPKLHYENGDFIKGYNYKKMHKSNLNCIYIDDTKVVLEKKIRKLFDFKYLFENSPSFKKEYLSNRNNYKYPKEFLPIKMLNQFSIDSKYISKIDLFDPKNRNKIYNLLYKTISEITSPISNEAKIHNEIVIKEWLLLNEKNTLELAKNRLTKFDFK